MATLQESWAVCGDVLGDGNQAVIQALSEAGSLLKEEPYVHKYPTIGVRKSRRSIELRSSGLLRGGFWEESVS